MLQSLEFKGLALMNMVLYSHCSYGEAIIFCSKHSRNAEETRMKEWRTGEGAKCTAKRFLLEHSVKTLQQMS